LKRKCDESHEDKKQMKKNKTETTEANSTVHAPIGLCWDQNNWSCAYDSLFVILYNIWAEDPATWTKRFMSIGNIYLSILASGFNMMPEQLSFEHLRNTVRMKLHTKDPQQFPMGMTGTSVAALCMAMLKPKYSVASSQLVCCQCNYKSPERVDKLTYVLHADPSVCDSTAKWIQTLAHVARDECSQCNVQMIRTIHYTSTPNLLVLEYPTYDIITSHTITIDVNKKPITLYLKGVVYAGGYHFTSRFISESGTMWYHDGMTFGRMCEKNGDIDLISDIDIRRCENKDLVLAVYAQ
jgi:hypothetical protein